MAGLVRTVPVVSLVCGVSVGPSAWAAPSARRASDIGRALLACWQPPRDGGEITLSLALRRDGSLIGTPRVTYVRSGTDKHGADELRATIFAAARSCTPIALSGPLQGAIAGQVLRIRFMAAPGASAGTASVIWTGT